MRFLPEPKGGPMRAREREENEMRKELVAGAVAIVMLAPALSFAQSPGAREGFREGYHDAGPVGGLVGETVGAALDLPGDVIGFVTGHPRHYDRVREHIVVGEPLPREVHVYTIPRHREYVYAYVNDERVLVDPRTHRVIRVIE
jgi:hypothetical protein